MSDVDYRVASEFVGTQKIPRLATLTLFIVCVMLVVLLIFSLVFRIDIRTMTVGDFGFSGDNTVLIEAPVSGELRELNVKLGDTVDPEELVASLRDYELQSRLEEEKIKILSAQLKLARLEAMRRNFDHLIFNDDFPIPHDLLVNANNHLKSDLQEYRSQMSELKEAYLLDKKEVDLNEPLQTAGHISMFEMDVMRRKADASRMKYEGFQDKRQADDTEEINTTTQMLHGQIEKMKQMQSRVNALSLRSPIEGTVTKLSVHKLGDMLNKGDEIAEVVAKGSPLVLKLFIQPTEIGFIKPGQQVSIQVDAYDFSVFGRMDGKVSSVAYNTVKRDAATGYEVTVSLDKPYLEYKDRRLPVNPGMTAVAHIITRQSSIFTYLVNPVIKTFIY